MSKRKRRQGSGNETASLQDDAGNPRRLLPVDVQQKEFRLAFRGYNEQDVDEFLDVMTEELARLHEENKRLAERLEEGGGYGGAPPGALIEEAQRRAEEIVREAREAATQILADAAPARAATGSTPPGPTMPAAPEEMRKFLGREREFLQGLASLIQQHAEAVKQDAQRARPAEEPSPAAVAPASLPEREPALEPEGAWAPAAEPAPEAAPEPASEPEAERMAESPSMPALASPPVSAAIPPLEPAAASAPDDAWTPQAEPDPWAGDEPGTDQVLTRPSWATSSAAPETPGESSTPAGGLEDTQAWTPEAQVQDEPAAPAEAEAPADAEREPSWSNPFSEGPALPSSARTVPALPDPVVPEPIAPDAFMPTSSGREWAPEPAQPAPEHEQPPEPTPLTGPTEPREAPRGLSGAPAARPELGRQEQTALGPQPPREPAEGESEDREEDDRSLRELFWGEE
jgi:DivIVA domain-containing protein